MEGNVKPNKLRNKSFNCLKLVKILSNNTIVHKYVTFKNNVFYCI